MSRIQSDLKTDLPRAMGSAWKVLMGRIAYFLRLSKNGVRKRSGHPFEHREVQLQHLLDRIEHAADAACPRIARDALHMAVGEKVDVELGPQLLQARGKRKGKVLVLDRAFGVTGRLEELPQDGRVMVRGVVEALVDRDGRERRVQDGGADRVLEAADGHRFVDEGVLGAAELAELGDLVRARDPRARGRDDEHLEIGPPVTRPGPSWRC